MTTKKSFYYEIAPPKGLVQINVPEILRYRELFYIFAWRDIKVRYKQTFFGIAWAIFQPFFSMVVFTIFFGRLAKIPSEGIPYPIFVYSGLLLWNYFSNALTSASDCLVASEGIIKKVYFPRLILPLSTTVTPIIDFLFALVILFVIMVYYHFMPNFYGILILPLLLFITFLSASGVGLFLSSINVKYRDVKYILPFFIQLLMFLTPVIYPVSLVPERYQWIVFLNPMAGVITTARSLLLASSVVDWGVLGYSLVVSLILFVVGLAYFRKTERFIADVL